MAVTNRKTAVPIPKEETEQRIVATYLNMKRLVWCHVPNGGKRTRAEAGIFKALGVKSGVPDVVIFDGPPKFPEARGAAVEMKRVKGGELSDNQKEWLSALEARGWKAHVARGAEDAIRWLTEECGY